MPRRLVLDGILLRLLADLETDLLLAHFVVVHWQSPAMVDLVYWGEINIELRLVHDYLHWTFGLVYERLRRCKLFVRLLGLCEHLLVNFNIFHHLTAFHS